MDKDQKRQTREDKRALKKDGNRTRRRELQRKLKEDPENAHEDDFEFNEHNTSTKLNGFDHDATRRRRQEEAWSDYMSGDQTPDDPERY